MAKQFSKWESVRIGGWAEGSHLGEIRDERKGVTGTEYLVHDFDEREDYWTPAHVLRARG